MSGIVLREVVSRRDRSAFIGVQARLQAGLKHAIRPLDFDMHSVLDPARSPFLKDNPAAAWIAYRDGAPVGRIMAIHDLAHLRAHDDGAGHFGFIEFEDDQPVVEALLDRAADWLGQRGLTSMVGPFSPSVNHETGLLIDGFDSPPAYLMNYAPPFYGPVLERAGLTKAMDLYSFTCDTDIAGQLPATQKLFARIAQTPGLVIRNLDPNNYKRDIALLVDVYNDGWSGNWGAVPMSDAEAQELGAMLRPLIAPEWLMVAEYQGEPIGVALQMPDLNEAVRDFGGRLLPFNWARLLYRMRKPAVRNSRMLMLGIRKSWQQRSVGPIAAMLLIQSALRAANEHDIRSAELGWILETNAAILSVVNKFSTKHRKAYRLYRRSI